MAGYQASLVRWHAVDPVTALQIVYRIPARFTLNEVILENATRELIVRAEQPDAEIIGPIQSLDQRRALPDHPRLQRIAKSAAAINAFLNKLDKLQPGSDLNVLAGELQGVWEADDDVVVLWIPTFVSLAQRTSSRNLGLLILRFLHDRPALLFARAWGRFFSDPESAHRTAASAFIWSFDESIPVDARRELAAQVESAYASMGEKGEAWRVSVSDYLWTDEERLLLVQFLDGDLGGRRRPLRLFGRK
jgi:hypothetical protein